MRIDKNIPVPEARRSSKCYPFPLMKSGDSIFLEAEKESKKAYAAAKTWARRHGAKFVSRKEGSGLRIWRVE
jgi:hypothetical protein